MPKINVYLPDELAESVKESGVPVSAICQRALEDSVRRVSAIRATVLSDLEHEDPTAKLTHFTQRARTAIRLGIDKAKADGATEVGTGHLMHGILAEGENLAVRLLPVLQTEPEHVRRELAKKLPTGDGSAERFSGTAANALELTVTEALSLGHNYIGCEHLLLGVLGEPDGTAGQVLRALGVEHRPTRQAVVTALSGYAHLRAQAGSQGAASDPMAAVTAAVRKELQPLIERIELLEERTKSLG